MSVAGKWSRRTETTMVIAIALPVINVFLNSELVQNVRALQDFQKTIRTLFAENVIYQSLVSVVGSWVMRSEK